MCTISPGSAALPGQQDPGPGLHCTLWRSSRQVGAAVTDFLGRWSHPDDQGSEKAHCGGEASNESALATVYKAGQKACPKKPPERGNPMRTSAIFAVCAGAPAVALCVGAPTAWAAPSTNVTQQTTNGSLSVSAGGSPVVQLGNESKATTTGASLSVAWNFPGTKGSTAEANGTGNFVEAGNNSSASATGNFNFVQAFNNSDADVTGNSDRVVAISNSHAEATGNNNMVTALCGGNANVSNQNNQSVLKAPCLGQ